ncbi:MAG: XAC2610-related protein [Pyrinomonadaceae bacterium]
MKPLVTALILLLTVAANAQRHFRLNDASKIVDVGIEVGTCDMGDSGTCSPLIVNFFRKRATKLFQTIRLAKTSMWDAVPKANVINLYDDQSVINFGDYNFDGSEDVAICDGSNGGYGGSSYQVYLYLPTSRRFIHSASFTRLVQGMNLGMFETDKKKKMHYVYSKSGCCWHQTEGYDVFGGRPRKVYEFTEDAMIGDGHMRVTTKKLVRGRWRVRTKSYNESEYYEKLETKK